MPLLSNPAFGPRTALLYVTGGTLACVWTLVWYFTKEAEPTRTQWFWVAGFFLSGATFVFLGLVLGPLGRAARQMELPPVQAVRAEATIQQAAATHPPVATVAPVVAQPGVPVGVAAPAPTNGLPPLVR